MVPKQEAFEMRRLGNSALPRYLGNGFGPTSYEDRQLTNFKKVHCERASTIYVPIIVMQCPIRGYGT